jgi:hypothetical protein
VASVVRLQSAAVVEELLQLPMSLVMQVAVMHLAAAVELVLMLMLLLAGVLVLLVT